METKIKTIIFDYDGTLIERDEKKIILESLGKIENSEKIAEFVMANRISMGDVKKTFQYAFDHFKIPFTEVQLEEYMHEYVNHYKTGIIRQEVKALLVEFSKNYELLLLSDGSKTLKIEELKFNNCLNFFKEIITNKDTGFSKSDSRALRVVLEKYNLKPEEVICIGNSLSSDISPAEKLKIKTIWISNIIPTKILKDVTFLNEEVISKL